MKNISWAPYPVRRAVKKLWPWLDGPFATTQVAPETHSRFPFEIATYACPILNPVAQRHLFENKLHNLSLAHGQLDGLVLRPDEVFSFWERVGPPDEVHGFRDGATFINHQVKAAVGGGLCQLSGLLYNAALLGGASILERHAHSIDAYGEGRYVPLGRDATVTYPRKDLCFRNPFGAPLLLRIDLRRTRVRASLHACHPLPWKVLILVSRPVREVGPTVVIEDPLLPAGTTRIEPGFEGKRVTAYRWFVTERGIERKELLSRDSYWATPTVLRMGVRPVRPGSPIRFRAA